MTKEQRIENLIARMRARPAGIKFSDLTYVCGHFFGEPRHMSGSHRIYRTPWPGDPRVNIQDAGGMAKAYQVRQVVAAIDRIRVLEEER